MNIQTKQIMKLMTYHFERNTAGNMNCVKNQIQNSFFYGLAEQ